MREMPDHCAFVLVIAPLGVTGDERGKGAYASNGNRQDAIIAMMDVTQQLQSGELEHGGTDSTN